MIFVVVHACLYSDSGRFSCTCNSEMKRNNFLQKLKERMIDSQ